MQNGEDIMKFKKIISLIIIVILLLNCLPLTYSAAEKTLTFKGSISDNITDVEYGWDGKIYRFNEDILVGVENDDEVYLVSDAKTTGEIKIGSRIHIELSNFRLEGTDAINYKLPDNAESMTYEKDIMVTNKIIKISPEHPYIYYGQVKPKEISEIADYKSQILNNEEVNISAVFEIQTGDNIGDYNISIKNDSISLTGRNAENYDVEIDGDVKFSVRKYEPAQEAYCEEVPDGNFIGVSEATIKAPEGFLLSENNDKNGIWKESIVATITETSTGSITYFLLNNNIEDTDCYGAISEAKVFKYTCVQTKPVVKYIKIESSDDVTDLNFTKEGIFTNGKITITVYVEGGVVPQNTTIYLGENSNYESKTVSAENAVFVNNKYTYSAVFEIDVNNNESVTKRLNAYASNSSGESEKYPAANTSDTFWGTETNVNKPITIDKKIPEVNIINVNGNFQHSSIKANFTVSDIDSGIAKIEYLWDDGFLINENDSEYQTEYVEIDNFSPDKTSYELVLPWNQAQTVPNNKHTLHLKVTDNAGNVYNDLKPFKDPIGSDMLSPNIESIEIRKAEHNEIDGILNFFTFGTFSNNTVEIAIKANDNETTTDYFASGVSSVTVNNRKTIFNSSTNEYILTVNYNDIINGIHITVEDSVGLSYSAFAIDIPERGFIKSNDLIVENDIPTIDFGNIMEIGHEDGNSNIWFGESDNDVKINITVSDEIDSIQSGLYSLKIMDNDDILYFKSNFDYKTLQHSESFVIGNLDDGKHVFSAEVTDNCGNTRKSSITIYKDVCIPDKGTISVASPESKLIGSEQWFDKGEIITFRIEANDALSGIKNISLKINDTLFDYNYSQIEYDETGYFILCDTSSVDLDSEHKYTVSGTVTDFAGNTLEMEPMTVHKDLSNPVIEKFTVQKKNDTIDKILNILTFGIYSNDSLILKVYTKDDVYDSGIDFAEISYDGRSNTKRMLDEGNGVFSFELSSQDEIFQSEFYVTVYDKFGKASVTCPNISDDSGTVSSEGRFVMIETISPKITLDLPASDSVSSDDNRVWYNSNKTIELRITDEESGINNIDLYVNGFTVTNDIDNIPLLKKEYTESLEERLNEEQKYIFDTNYLAEICGESDDGKYDIDLEITDNAGNLTVYKTTYHVDKIAPTIDRIDFVPKTSDGIENTSEFIEKLEYGYYFKTDFYVIVNVSDMAPSSGLYEVKYRYISYDSGKFVEEITGRAEISGGKATLDVPKGFKGQIFVEAFDYVLNSSGEKTAKAYVVDKVKPDIQITNNADTNYHDENGNKLYVETNSFTVVITDTVSGIKQIGYSQMSEQNQYDRRAIDIANKIYDLQENIGDGWVVTGVDVNLVTQLTKTFYFENDDNDIILTFDATDNSGNKIEDVESEKFTIDKTEPIINVVFRDEENDMYYNHNRIADITVTERNFDENLIDVQIENTFGEVPSYSFVKNSNNEYTAVIEFDEGDYTFNLFGKDLGNHSAIINYSGGNENIFYVDKTIPVIEENFSEFSNEAENSFNTDKTAVITITEHNFDPEQTNLKIMRKAAGSEHDENTLEDVTPEILGSSNWNSTGDIHTISFTFDFDAVYYIEVSPVDLASNEAETHNTDIFEIDKTAPVISMRNDEFVSEDDTQFLDIYPYSRKDDETPSVTFEDLNISYIKYELITYIPDYSQSDLVVVDPVATSGTIEGNKYILPDFTEDGVYALKLMAVDIAGNESELNLSTYAKMVNQDVLAFILDSNIERKSGIFSIEYENGEAISKKASDFDDLNVFIMAKEDTPVNIVLRDNNGNDIQTNAEYVLNDSVYGIDIYNCLIEGEFFKEKFQDDTDIELNLTVINQEQRIDLGKIHIDNIAPSCDIPDYLSSWHWFYGTNERQITISDISELIDENACKIYDNGEIIPFDYSNIDNTITFTLEEGWHNIGIVLVDMAGNANNIQELNNIHVGYFWLWLIIITTVALSIICIFIIIINKRRNRFESNDIM